MDRALDFACCRGSLPRTEGVLNLTPAEALENLAQGALLVDLREAYETNFRVFDVKEVVYLPWTRFYSSFRALPFDRALILADAAGIYCREAARILGEAGYTNIAKLSGGMIDWDAAKHPVRKDTDYELGGQCACRIKTRHGGNPLIEKPYMLIG
jgi:rhodanese-related sulfurtransferase